MQNITTQLAGTSFNGRKRNLKGIPPGVWLEQVPEPDNPNDPNAICLYYDDKEVGYVPREHAERFKGKIQAVLLHENELITLVVDW